MSPSIWCFILLLFFCVTTIPAKKGRTYLVLIPKVFSNCDIENNHLNVEGFELKVYGKHHYFLNYNISFLTGFKTLLRLTADITTCRDMVQSANTCEHFQRWNWERQTACDVLDNKNAFYFDLIRNVEPGPIRCPLAPGTYIYKNCTLDVNLLQLLPFPLEGNLWVVDVDMVDLEERSRCFHMEFIYQRVRG